MKSVKMNFNKEEKEILMRVVMLEVEKARKKLVEAHKNGQKVVSL